MPTDGVLYVDRKCDPMLVSGKAIDVEPETPQPRVWNQECPPPKNLSPILWKPCDWSPITFPTHSLAAVDAPMIVPRPRPYVCATMLINVGEVKDVCDSEKYAIWNEAVSSICDSLKQVNNETLLNGKSGWWEFTVGSFQDPASGPVIYDGDESASDVSDSFSISSISEEENEL